MIDRKLPRARTDTQAEYRAVSPLGWRYQESFLAPAEEESLLRVIRTLEFESARYKEWTARRRIVSYGARYDFSRNQLQPAPPIPAFLIGLRQQAAQWAGLPPQALSHASIAEYPPPAQLGWHRDVPEFESVVGVSLLGAARMRFRPYPPRTGQRTSFTAALLPRSIYLLSGAVRWKWQHAISPTKELRYSITFRTLRAGRVREEGSTRESPLNTDTKGADPA